MAKLIEIKRDGQKLPFHAYVNGKLLRKKDGTGRRFKTEAAARKAAEAA
jgi:hypothetical protein